MDLPTGRGCIPIVGTTKCVITRGLQYVDSELYIPKFMKTESVPHCEDGQVRAFPLGQLQRDQKWNKRSRSRHHPAPDALWLLLCVTRSA